MACFFRYKWNGSKCSSYGATLKRECATNNSNKGILWRTISTILLVLVLMLSNVSCANTSDPATFVGFRIGNINNYCAVINLNGSFVDAELPEEFIIETEHIKDFPEGLAGIIDDISISFNNPKIIAEGMNEKGNVVIAINEDCVATVGLEGKTEFALRVRVDDFNKNIPIKEFFDEYTVADKLNEMIQFGICESTFLVKKKDDLTYNKTLNVGDQVKLIGNKNEGYTIDFAPNE